MPPLYNQWLLHVFDRPTTPNGWYFDLEELEEVEFEASNTDVVTLIAHTLRNCKNDLAQFSDNQVNDGLNFIFSNACSNTVFAMKDEKVATEDRLNVIKAIQILYTDCFFERCAPVLCHIDEAGSSPINTICYMLWDVSPIARWEREKNKEVFYQAVLDVMKYGLALKHPACIESALHGLGHSNSYCPDEVSEIISSFLKHNPNLSPQLRYYAERAIIGDVQ